MMPFSLAVALGVLLFSANEPKVNVVHPSYFSKNLLFAQRLSSPKIARMRVFSFDAAHPKGFLLTDTRCDANGNPLQVDTYDPQGSEKIAATTTNTYNELGQLVKIVKNYDGQWDHIKERTYNANGQLSLELWGNNRTGVWGSEQYFYNQKGDVEQIDFHKKSGALKKRAFFERTYDANGRLVRTVEKQQPEGETASILVGSENCTYNAKGQLVGIEAFDANGKTTRTERVEWNAQGRKAKETFTVEGIATAQAYTYNANGDLLTSRTYQGGALVLTTSYTYDGYGNVIRTAYQPAKGSASSLSTRYEFW